jgi:hypothetical protein
VVSNPGTYHITVTAPLHAAFERDVVVGDSRLDVDIQL